MEEKEITPKQINKKSNVDGKDERDEKEARNCLKKANYKCEIDENHNTFISESTRENYVEAHHLIPFKEKDNYEYSLDVPGNLVALCPNCHRKIHLSIKEEQMGMVEYLYNQRKELLEKYGLKVTLQDLLKLY